MTEGAQPAPKPNYFDDPAVQALYQMVLVLGEELAATREQLHALIALAEKGDIPTAEAIDCLLYTSPSPRDATLSRMPSSA